MRYTIGIDPGQKGGLAFVNRRDTQRAWAYRYPGDAVEAARIIREFTSEHGVAQLAVLEKVHAMPKQGVSSTFKFGQNYGAWQGVLAALEIPFILVTPQKWQKVMLDSAGKQGGDKKDRSLEMARRLWPDIDMRYKADDGKAEALLMARFGILYLKGEVI